MSLKRSRDLKLGEPKPVKAEKGYYSITPRAFN